MTRYLMSVLSSRVWPGPNGTLVSQVEVYKGVVEANSHDEAVGLSHRIAAKRFPKSAGWGTPDVDVSSPETWGPTTVENTKSLD